MKKSKQGQNTMMQRAWLLGSKQRAGGWRREDTGDRGGGGASERLEGRAVCSLKVQLLGLWLWLRNKYKAIGEFGTKEKYKHLCVPIRFLSCSAARSYAEGDYRKTQRGQTEDGHALQDWDCRLWTHWDERIKTCKDTGWILEVELGWLDGLDIWVYDIKEKPNIEQGLWAWEIRK